MEFSSGREEKADDDVARGDQPRVLLLDEPLSNLDAKLREEARSWLRTLIHETRISALYVTHDQVEAMAVADRVLFLRDGRIEQEGTPEEMYERPATAVTADFMGSNNTLAGVVGAVDDPRARLDLDGAHLWGTLRGSLSVGEMSTAFIRVERTRLADCPGDNRLALRLDTALYLGERWEYVLSRGPLRIRVWGRTRLDPGERWVEFPPDDLWLF